MDTSYLLSLLQELTFLLAVFGLCLTYAIIKGRQALINLIMGLYFALLISLVFPYYETFIPATTSAYSGAVGRVVLFVIFALIATILITRLMPEEYREKKFESFGKKLMLAAAGTILIMAFSFHVLPVTEILTPGTPISTLFASKDYFFWWLLTPMIFLYLN
ncbi:MAG: hypothetical protein ACK42D_03860 [Candidatus Paceibacteria bacterium]